MTQFVTHRFGNVDIDLGHASVEKARHDLELLQLHSHHQRRLSPLVECVDALVELYQVQSSGGVACAKVVEDSVVLRVSDVNQSDVDINTLILLRQTSLRRQEYRLQIDFWCLNPRYSTSGILAHTFQCNRYGKLVRHI